MADTHK